MTGMASAAAAIAIGVAVASEFATFAVIAAVGATLGAIGTVAKIPELKIAGAVIGAVGAIGGLASAAGLFGEAGSFFGAGESILAADDAFNSVSTFGAMPAGSAGLSDVAASTTFAESASPFSATGGGDIVTSVTSGFDPATFDVAGFDFGQSPVAVAETSPSVVPSGTEQIDPLTSGMDNTVLQGSEGSSPQIAEAPKTPVADAPDAPQAPSSVPATGTNTLGTVQTGPAYPSGGIINNPLDSGIPGSLRASQAAVAAAGPADMAGSQASIWSDILKFAKNNQTLMGGVLQAGGALIGGIFDTEKPAKTAYYEGAAKYYEGAANKANADASLTKMQMNNLSQPLPTATRTGLINTPRLAPVTGVPA